MPRRTDLTQPIDRERYMRADARGIALAEGAAPVDREGGDYGAGLIRGAAVITRGEARGHEMWIDREMLQQVHDALAAAGDTGVKARFTHPGLSSDGLGTYLGRWKNSRLDGDVVRADLHLARSAHETPDGDLATYVMDLAEEDPAAFGTSIVFRHDRDAEEQHRATHTKNGRFYSPDERNTEHYPHARLRELRAVDAVDSPAANPSGLFHRQDFIAEAEAVTAYSLGLTTQRPELATLSVDPDRAAGFVRHFLDRHNLKIVPKQEPDVSNQQDQTPADRQQSNTPDATTSLSIDPADVERFQQAFGTQGLAWLLEGKTYEQAEQLHAQQQAQAKLAELEQQLKAAQEECAAAKADAEQLRQRIEALKAGTGEQEPLTFSDGEPSKSNPEAKKHEAALGSNLAKVAASLKLAKK